MVTTPHVDEGAATGHLFVVRADMFRLDCDALLVSTGPEFHFSAAFAAYLGSPPFSARQPPDIWEPGEIVRDLGVVHPGGPRAFAGQVAVGYHESVTYQEGIRRAAEAALAYVAEAAATVTAAAHRSNQPPRVALPMVGLGLAGLGEVTGDIIRPLVNGLQAAARTLGVDVVLCVIDDMHWSAVQQVRVGDWQATAWRLSERLVNCAADIARHVRENDLVLFMGAGVGRDAGLPDWDGLLDGLAERAGMSVAETTAMRALDPRDRARLIERRSESTVGRSGMREFISEQLSVDRFGLSHALLASLSVSSAVTTNFDTLYEQACALRSRPSERPRRLPYEAVTSGSSWLLKLHGDVDEGDVVITRSDYLGLARHRSALFGVVQALLLTRHLLFVGYSMTDDDFHTLVDEIESALGEGASRHLGTALVLQSSLTTELWDDLVDIELMDLGDGNPPERRLLMFLDLVACFAADHSAHLLDRDFEGLLTPEEAGVADRLRQAFAAADALPEGSVAKSAMSHLRRKLGGDGG